MVINPFDLKNLDGNNGFVFRGVNEFDFAGGSVSGVGDINGDGIDDVIIGATGAEVGDEFNQGESYVIFGSSNGMIAEIDRNDLDGSNGFIVRGIDLGDSSGFSVSGAGDVNGDGIDDLIIGAPQAEARVNPGFSGGAKGESYLVFGSSDGFTAELDLANLNGSNGFVLRGVNRKDYSGRSVSGAGDINGDGIDDLIIGAWRAESAERRRRFNQGESYVVFGNRDGFTTEFALASLDGSNGFVLRGFDRREYAGFSVSGAGDINGDGIDDLIIGAPAIFSSEPGESYVVFGSRDGFAGEFDLGSLDGSNGFILRGIEAFDEAGISVSGAGDINGDGIDDLIIGAPEAEAGNESNQGESYVVFGSRDSFAGEFDLGSLDGSNGFILRGIEAFDEAGISVSGAGDVNGDGIDDLIIGTEDAKFRGESYLVFGSRDDFAAVLDLGSLDGSNGVILRGINEGEDLSSSAVSDAGDVNGDGIDDLIIGASLADLGDETGRQGETYVVFGTDLNLVFGAESDDLLTGSEQDDFISGLKGNDIISALAGADQILGGSGDDTLSGNGGDDRLVGGNGNDRLVGGNGNDTLIGVDSNSVLGTGEQDILIGDTRFSSDTFVLGDENGVFYNDGAASTAGEGDFALIRRFDATEDIIQLQGSTELYSLEFSSVGSKINARLIFAPESEETGELIAVITDVDADLSLNDSAFSFV